MCTKAILCTQVIQLVSKAVTTRLRSKLLREIEQIAKDENTDRSSIIQKLIRIGLKVYKIEKALALYRDKKVSLWRAAEIAGIPLREMIDELEKRGIPYHYDIEILEEFVDNLISKMKQNET